MQQNAQLQEQMSHSAFAGPSTIPPPTAAEGPSEGWVVVRDRKHGRTPGKSGLTPVGKAPRQTSGRSASPKPHLTQAGGTDDNIYNALLADAQTSVAQHDATSDEQPNDTKEDQEMHEE